MTKSTPIHAPLQPQQIRPGLWRFSDTCNVYVLCDGEESLAIDFGSGAWLKQATQLGLPRLRHVVLTHHHSDQCAGLLRHRMSDWLVHAPVAAKPFLEPAAVDGFWLSRNTGGVPISYSVLPRGLPDLSYDMAGFCDWMWRDRRLRFLHTPGHGPDAISIIIDHGGEQVVFCGDAAHDDARMWQPYHMEWDHWTAGGALAAWQGVQRLIGVNINVLCPSHGPVVVERPRLMLKQLARRLMDFVHAKGSIASGEPDRYIHAETIGPGLTRLSPSLYHFGSNGYLVLDDRQALVIDATIDDMPELQSLALLLNCQVTTATATHYHCDHVDGLPALQTCGTKVALHPRLTEALEKPSLNIPWKPPYAIRADEHLPSCGWWRWGRYRFRTTPFAGQTWWHAALQCEIDGQRVFFGGDNFQPASRWNGTGGFCAMNGCRFGDGFERSAQLLLKWRPDVLACGHNTQYRFAASQFKKVQAWSRRAERAVRALCPHENIKSHYYCIIHQACSREQAERK